MLSPDLQHYITQLLGSLGVSGMNGLTWPANPPPTPINDPWMSGPITDGRMPGVGTTPAPQPVGTAPNPAGGPPPGMGWRRPGFPGQGHAYGRMGRPGMPPTTPPTPSTGITGAGIADPSKPGQVTSGPILGGGYPLAPGATTTAASAATSAPQPRPANFGQTMSAWAHSKPDRPDNFSGAWGQSSQMDAWRNRQPTHAGFATKPLV